MVKRRKSKVGRIIGGKDYLYDSTHTTKAEAKQAAKKIRERENYNARVIKNAYNYSVYWLPKKGVKY